MKRLSKLLMCLFALVGASLSAKAQEIVVDLFPGWNWISYPNAETMDIVTALGDFTPMSGDIINSQYSSTSFNGVRWRGGLTHFMPGWGYMYYSNRDEMVSFVFNKPPMPTGTLTVTTGELANITSTTAACGGSAVSNDGTTILMKGVCWATHPEPTTNDSYTETETGPGTFTATMTELTPETEYYVRAYAVSVKGINYGEELSFTTVSHDYVDLGLPSGLLWATCNVGADSPEDYGDYFAWGETQPKDYYDWNTYQYCNSNYNMLTKYNNNYSYGYNGFIDYLTILQPEDDAANTHWADGSRTPTIEEWQELEEHCTSTWTTLNGVNGRLFTGTNGNTLFLPAAGELSGNQLCWENDGKYWSSTLPTPDYPFTAWYCSFNSESISFEWSYMLWGSRDRGRNVRPVHYGQSSTCYSIEITPNPSVGGVVTGAGTYVVGQTCIVTATANEGYVFEKWTDNGTPVSTYSEYSFPVANDKNIVACFSETSTYPLHYSFNANDHTATVTGHWDGQNVSGDLAIPETVMHNGEIYTVTAIGDNAFNGCSNLTSVEFPNTLVSIGGYAFSGCSSLTSIEFPNSLESIGDWAFRYCNGFTSVFIPASVTQIGVNPFTECSNISQITVESGNAYYDSRDNCNAIIETNSNKLISGCLNTIVPSAVTSLGQDAFYIESLTSVTILAETPPTLGTCSFCGVDKSIPVYVPCASIEAYQIASGWSEFTNFIGVGQCSGIVTVTASPEEYGTVTGGGYYENSASCTVTATPNEGYYFLCWKEDGQWVSSQATYTFPVYRDRNLTAVFTIGAENIINGDFEQGNVGFTSEYYYNFDFNGYGQYYVDNNAHGYPGFGHGGMGNFMMIDGATESGVVVWSEQVSVEPNTYYTFSTWACTLAGPNALLQFSINGTSIGVLASPLQTNTWQQFSAVWYSGDSTTATITIVDLNTEWGGNDFGLDDISFRELDPSVNSGRGSMR